MNLTITGFFKLKSLYSVIEVTGPDAGKFLQGQLSCDILNLLPNQQTLGAYCNLKGRIKALFNCYCLQINHYFLRVPNDLLSKSMQELKKYAIFSKVQLLDITENWNGTAILASDLNALFSVQQTNPFNTVFKPIYLENYMEVHCVRPLNTVPINDEWSITYPELSMEQYKQYKINHFIPEVYLASSEVFLPHYLNLPNLKAVSFTKGCYCGQEIIARMQYKATIKRGLIKNEIPLHLIGLDNLQPGKNLTINKEEQKNMVIIDYCLDKQINVFIILCEGLLENY